ncbi:MAG: BON domain-containing protein [Gemmatimonadaceae bacterium]|nr:BON domain-containing protein [Gemmatimonadaceae bacterium]
MRTIRLDDDGGDNTLLWVGAGAAVGVIAGVLIAERMSGRKLSLKDLAADGQRLAKRAIKQWGPIMETVSSLKDVWAAGPFAAGVAAAVPKGAFDDDPEDEPPDPIEDDELDEDLEEESDDDDFDEDDDEDDEDYEDEEEELHFDSSHLDARVLECFQNDPILAERAVEIESEPAGTIVLHGRVRTAREVKHAVTLARGVPGVRTVRQRLAVRSRA